MKLSHLLAGLVLVFSVAGCSIWTSSNGPVVGSGGLFQGTPSASDIQSGKAIFRPGKFSKFEIGETRNAEVVGRLGQPNGWETNQSGELTMQYWYVESATAAIQMIIYTEFRFGSNGVLASMKNTTWEELGRG